MTMKRGALFLGIAGIGCAACAGGGRNRVTGSETLIAQARAPVTVDGDVAEWDASQAKLLTLFSGGGENVQTETPLAKCSAKISFRCDSEALYAAVWWKDPSPLGPERSDGCFPPGDGLLLTLPLKRMTRLAFWREPGKTEAHARLSAGDTPPAQGKALTGVSQGFKVTGKESYTQELRITWDELGGKLNPGTVARIGVELCFGGLDAAAGYTAFVRDTEAGRKSDGNRWGGNMGWGFMDGIRTPDQIAPGFDPANGATVALMPADSVAPENPAVLHNGNEQTRTTAMIAVPAGKIAVDGKLEPDEWEAKSATRIASEPALFPNRYAVDIHWAYDGKGLYAGLRWHTGGPRLNINNPVKTGRGFDGGDALQLRLGTDRVSHIDLWYYDAARQPAACITYGAKFDEGSVPDALAKGAALAVQPQAGGGYTEELFLPWALLTKEAKPLEAGAAFRVVFDLFFSGLEGNRIPFIINAQMEQPSSVITLPYAAPEDGLYTVAVADAATGQTLRRLASVEKMRKGQSVAEWDGLDDRGVPAKPGKYAFKGLRHTGIGLTYLMTLNNPGTPPWQSDDGKGEWGGDHGPPQAVAADAQGVYLGWPSAEDGNGIIGCDLEGRKRWGFFQTPCPSAAGGVALLAADGQNLYFANEVKRSALKGEKELAYFKTVITCLDKDAGYRRGFSAAKPYHEISSHDTTQVKAGWYWDLLPAKSHSLDTCGIRDDYFFSGHCAGANLAGLAAKDGRVYVSLRVPGEVAVFSSADLTELARWKLAKPAGLAFAADGTLFGISGQTVVRLNLSDGSATPVIRAGLDAPVALAVDGQGAFYVSDWGAAHCVKVFDASGRPARTIGKAGGRPWTGAYDRDGMLLPRGIAVDKNGLLWVAEDENKPRRISVWNASSGAFVKEFIGGATYGGTQGGLVDPSHPDRVYSDGAWFHVNLGKEGYRPLFTLGRRRSIDNYLSELNGNTGHAQRIIKANGRRYLSTVKIHQILIGELMPDGDWRPCVVIGGIFNRGDNPETKREKNLLWRESPAPAFFAAHAGENYIWTDANADGLMQEQEFQWRKQDKDAFPCWTGHWGVGMFDQGLNAYIGGNGVVVRFAFRGWAPSGAPRYDIQDARPVSRQDGTFKSLCVDSRQRVLTLNPAETKRWGEKNQTLSGFDAEGRLRWSIPTSTDYRKTECISGEGLMGPVNAGGDLGDIVGVTQWHGLHVPLVTTDGLLVAKLLRDPAEGGAPGPDVYKGETIQCLTRLDDGRIILAHGKNAHHLFEVIGLAQVRRFDGEFELSDGQAAQAEQLLAETQSRRERTVPVRVAAVKAAVAIDGKLDDWSWKSAAGIGPKTGQPRAEVSLSADGTALYLAYKVFKKGPFINKGEELRQLFVGGDAVDFQFCSETTADPQRKAADLGDCRLLLSRFGDRPVAVLYRAKVPGAKQPVAFRNPSGTEVTFDEVLEIKEANVVIADTPEGYAVEASVPLKALFDSQPALWKGRVVPGDVGVVVADSTSRRVARLCRFNQETHVVNDLPAEARIEPARWGEIEVE